MIYEIRGILHKVILSIKVTKSLKICIIKTNRLLIIRMKYPQTFLKVSFMLNKFLHKKENNLF